MKNKNKTNKNKKRKTDNSFSKLLTPLNISILALIFSIFSISISYKQFDLSKKQDIEEKTGIWIGDYNVETDDFSFKSNNENISLQHASIYFPSGLNVNTAFITPPNYAFSTLTLESAITEYIDKKHKRISDSYQVIESDIPIVINSSYIAGGNLHSKTSGYSIYYIATLPAEDYKPPIIQIKGMWFSHHVPSDLTNLQSYLDLYWDAVYSTDK